MIKYWDYLREYRKLKREILNSVNNVFESGTLLFGEELKKFEKNFRKFNNSKYGLGVGSGTDALFIALKTLGIGIGDEVITVSNTAIPTVAAIKNAGAKVRFVDIGKDFLIDVKKIKRVISSKTKAIVPVHLFGQTCNMKEILSISKKYNLKIIEDCAEAHGVEYKGKKVGSIGDIGTFSFYANKTFTSGEGGMIVTNSKVLAEKAKSLKNLSYGKVNRFVHDDIGFNYRLPNISAAIGLGQFSQKDKILFEKKRIYDRYKKNLKNIKGINIPLVREWVTKYIMWVFNLHLDNNFSITRDQLVKKLDEKNIETRNAFVPINKQNILIQKYCLFKEDDCPHANYIMENGFYLPSGNTVTNEEIDFVCNKIKAISKS